MFIASSCSSQSTLLPYTNSYVHVHSETHSLNPYVRPSRAAGPTDGTQFANVLTHAHGFVARDDTRREIVVAFRGSYELADVLTGTFAHFMTGDPCSSYY